MSWFLCVFLCDLAGVFDVFFLYKGNFRSLALQYYWLIFQFWLRLYAYLCDYISLFLCLLVSKYLSTLFIYVKKMSCLCIMILRMELMDNILLYPSFKVELHGKLISIMKRVKKDSVFVASWIIKYIERYSDNYQL